MLVSRLASWHAEYVVIYECNALTIVTRIINSGDIQFFVIVFASHERKFK